MKKEYYEKLKHLYNWGVSKDAFLWGYSLDEFINAVCLFVASETGGVAFTRDPENPLIWWAHAYEEEGTIGLMAYKKILQRALSLGVRKIKVVCINPKIASLCRRLKFTCIEEIYPKIYEYNMEVKT